MNPSMMLEVGSSITIDRGIYLDLKKVYGSSTPALVEMLTKPPKRLYLRVNTLRTSRDSVIESFREQNIIAKRDELLEEAIYIEIDGPFKVEDTGKYVIVDDFAAESIIIGANLYRPGILKYDRFEKNDVITAITVRGQLIANLEARVSSEMLKNMDKGLVAVNIRSVYRAPPIAETKEYLNGLIYPQSFPAMVVGRIINPGQEFILDMNASPGGKTSHIVQLSKGKALIVAVDRSPQKIEKLDENLKRLRLHMNVLSIPFDSRYLDLVTKLEGRIDKVLIDPPCSNLGVRPRLSFKKTMRDVLSLANYQRQFIKVASKLVKNGGLIFYSTCTLTRAENEENIVYAMRSLGLTPVELEPLPRSDVVYYNGAVGYRFHPLKDDMPGFYISVLKKP
ncbi:PUA domain-containing protein [Thermogladius sp. 4427co]|uniref:PUA domain-containing protein n=1 Tax=Thermogladius sp. 4427co TaxID=3450718 RepID=UPI003F7909D9